VNFLAIEVKISTRAADKKSVFQTDWKKSCSSI